MNRRGRRRRWHGLLEFDVLRADDWVRRLVCGDMSVKPGRLEVDGKSGGKVEWIKNGRRVDVELTEDIHFDRCYELCTGHPLEVRYRWAWWKQKLRIEHFVLRLEPEECFSFFHVMFLAGPAGTH